MLQGPVVALVAKERCEEPDAAFCVPSQQSMRSPHLCAGLWQGNHDGLAAFMAATGRAALPEAAALSGLSLQKEFELCKGG